jgi:hypothetical protein
MISVRHSPRIYVRWRELVKQELGIWCPLTIRLIRNNFPVPSGPALISRSRASDDPRLNAGEVAPDGPGIGEIVGENDTLSALTDGCRC